MKTRKVALTGKDLFTNRIVFAAEPGRGVRKLYVKRKTLYPVNYVTITYENKSTKCPTKALTKHHQIMKGDVAAEYAKRFDPTFEFSPIEEFWLVKETCTYVNDSVVLVEMDKTGAYGWPLKLIKGDESSTRLFSKEKQAIRYANTTGKEGLESLFDFIS